MPKDVDWKSKPMAEVVAEYERRKRQPSVRELWEALGLTKQGFHYQLAKFRKESGADRQSA